MSNKLAKSQKSIYVILIALLSDMKISFSTWSFSPQISTGGSSSFFHTRTTTTIHPRAET